MTDTWITLGLYVVGILGGAYVGCEYARSGFRKTIDSALKDVCDLNNRQFATLCTYEKMAADLRNQLAKFHTMRDKTGRFVKRQ